MAAKRGRSDTDDAFDNQMNFEKLYLNSKWSDVNFAFKCGKSTIVRVPAHKMLLANGSDIFAAKFYGQRKENGDITMTDVSIGALKAFLQFFYLNRVRLTVENVADVMKLGRKYNATKCIDACLHFMKNTFTAENVCIGLNHALIHNHKEMQEHCKKYIALNSEMVLKSNSFLQCDKSILAHILNFDSLTCSETIVFEACMTWIKIKSQQNEVTKQLIQEHLGELFYKIRFTTMAVKEFDNLSIAHDYAFSFVEYKDIMLTFASPPEASKLFNENPRRILRYDGAVTTCDRNLPGSTLSTSCIPCKQSTIFEVNQPMLLGSLVFAPISVGCDGILKEEPKSGLSIHVTINEVSNSGNSADGSLRTLLKSKIHLGLQAKETSIKLSKPVPVRPGFHYEILLNPHAGFDEYYYTCGGLMAEVQMQNKLKINFHDDFKFEMMNLVTGLGFD